MGRIEEGSTPPLHPRKSIIEPQQFSREQLTPHIPFSEVLAAAQRELIDTGTIMPSHKRISRRSLRVFGLASENSIKTKNFEEQFPHVWLRRMTGDEKHTGDTHIDAQSKAVTAAEKERQYRREHPFKVRFIDGQWRRATVTSGLDVVNFLPTTTDEGNITFQRIGKPQRINPEDPMGSIQRRFVQLSEMAQGNNWPSIPYGIEMTTYIHNPKKPDTDAESKRKAIVMLDPKMVAYIATDEGFKKYQETQTNESHLTLPQIAAGIQIERLNAMGAVQYIANSAEELFSPSVDPERYNRAKRLALSNFDISLLKEYQTKFPPRVQDLLRRAKRKTN